MIVTKGRGKGPHPHPPRPRVKTTTVKPTDEEGNDTQTRKKYRCEGIDFVRDDTLGEHRTARTAINEATRTMRIELNGAIEIIALSYSQPNKLVGLFPIIAREISNFCKEHAKDIDTMLPGFVDYLNKLGYQIEPDYPEQLADKVFTYIMKQCPLTSAERAKLGKVKLAEETTDNQEEVS